MNNEVALSNEAILAMFPQIVMEYVKTEKWLFTLARRNAKMLHRAVWSGIKIPARKFSSGKAKRSYLKAIRKPFYFGVK